jgi:hypothetical protein
MNNFLEKQVVKATFNPSAVTTERTIAAHGLGVFIPMNAVITNVFYDVVTTFTSAANDTATIAIHIMTANDCVSAIAISNVTNPWDVSIHTTKVGAPTLSEFHASNNPTAVQYATTLVSAPALTMIKTDANCEITATVAVQALTAGKLNIFVEYVMSE